MEKTQITKGDMFYADLGTNIGSEQNGTRPVIIIQMILETNMLKLL